MELSLDLLKLLLPELLVSHFNIESYNIEKDTIHLFFEEKNNIPKEAKHKTLIAHGFHKEITIQDFPLRGKKVFLHIKRRRWLEKTRKEIVQRDWNLVAQGTRMTIEFATFLKALNNY